MKILLEEVVQVLDFTFFCVSALEMCDDIPGNFSTSLDSTVMSSGFYWVDIVWQVSLLETDFHH